VAWLPHWRSFTTRFFCHPSRRWTCRCVGTCSVGSTRRYVFWGAERVRYSSGTHEGWCGPLVRGLVACVPAAQGGGHPQDSAVRAASRSQVRLCERLALSTQDVLSHHTISMCLSVSVRAALARRWMSSAATPSAALWSCSITMMRTARVASFNCSCDAPSLHASSAAQRVAAL